MDSKVKIKLDNATLSRGADGVITISKGGGCLPMSLLIGSAIIGSFSAGMIIFGVVNFFAPGSQTGYYSLFRALVLGLLLIAFSGYAVYYFYSSIRREQITIIPILNVVKTGRREIKFNDITDIAVEESPVPAMKGVVAIKFLFTLASDEKMELGRITIEGKKTEKREKIETEVITFLKAALKKN